MSVLPPYPPYESCLATPTWEQYFSEQTEGTVGWIVCAYFEGGSTTGWGTDKVGLLAEGSTQAQVETAVSAAYGNWASLYLGGSAGFVNVTEVNGVTVYEFQLQGYVYTPYGPVSTIPPMPVEGPTVNWITGQEAAACCSATYADNAAVWDMVAVEAGMLLYQMSGRQFPGLTHAHVRPMNQACGCSWASGLGPWLWLPGGYAGGYAWGGGYGAGWGWWNENGQQMGCNGLSRVRLSGYPVRQILKVTINGEVLDPDCYRLDEWRYLTRMSLPGATPDSTYIQGFWPSCQALDLNDDQPGTFSVDYLWGVPPPPLGLQAAKQMACQLYLACGDGEDCVLPAGVTKVTRQGIEVERELLADFFSNTGTGLVAVDAFLSAYNRTRAKMRAAVWSPDVQGYSRPIGNTSGDASCASLLGMNDLGI
jgi:hypothetical protein